MNRCWYLIIVVLLFLTKNGLGQKFYEVSTLDSAKVKVYAVDVLEQADLLVYFVYEAKDVTKVGFWMEVPTAKEAQVLIIFVDEEKQADLKIFLVDAPEQAGWRNESKKDLLKLE